MHLRFYLFRQVLATAVSLAACGSGDGRSPDGIASGRTEQQVCAIPLEAPPAWSGDTISAASRCEMLLLARRELARMPDAEPHLAPSDTARIVGAQVYDLDIKNAITGAVTPMRQIEVDIEGRPQLFTVTLNRRTGEVDIGVVHRGGI